MSEQFHTLADRLDVISEELAEVALAELSQAIRGGASKRPAAERAVTQARRAVEKAAHLLRSIDADNESAGSHELD
jgi:hypothetical protein